MKEILFLVSQKSCKIYKKRVINTLDDFMEKVQADIDRYQMWLNESKAQKEILIALKDELF